MKQNNELIKISLMEMGVAVRANWRLDIIALEVLIITKISEMSSEETELDSTQILHIEMTEILLMETDAVQLEQLNMNIFVKEDLVP